MRGLMVDVGFFLKSFSFMVYFHRLNVFSFFAMFFLVLSVLLLAAYVGSALRGGHCHDPCTAAAHRRPTTAHGPFPKLGPGAQPPVT